MFSYEGLLLLLTIAAVAAFWRASLVAREAAQAAAAASCARSAVQLLDQAFAIADLRLRRDGSGRLCFWRVYEFEFSLDGSDRHAGRVALFGARVEFVQLDRPDGRVIDGQGRLV